MLNRIAQEIWGIGMKINGKEQEKLYFGISTGFRGFQKKFPNDFLPGRTNRAIAIEAVLENLKNWKVEIFSHDRNEQLI